MVSQVDCYKRNYGIDTCSVKCPFQFECSREFGKREMLVQRLKQKHIERAMREIEGLGMLWKV